MAEESKVSIERMLETDDGAQGFDHIQNMYI